MHIHVGMVGPNSRIQQPSQPGSYHLRSRQPNLVPTEQAQPPSQQHIIPVSAKKQVQQPSTNSAAVSAVSVSNHPLPPSSSVARPDKERVVPSNDPSNAKPPAG